MNWIKRLWSKITKKNTPAIPTPVVVPPVQMPMSYWEGYWDGLQIDANRVDEVMRICRIGLANKSKYIEVQNATGHPWWGVFAKHYRESSLSFSTYLHNGEMLGQTTKLVPKGIYFAKGQWIEAAIHAIKYDGLNKVIKTIPEMLACDEKFNGLGYKHRVGDKGVIEASPYVLAGTNKHDETGKFVADGKYSPTAVEKQLGTAALYKGLQMMGEI